VTPSVSAKAASADRSRGSRATDSLSPWIAFCQLPCRRSINASKFVTFTTAKNGLYVRRLSSAFRLTDYCNSCFYALLLSTTKKGGTSAINRENLLPGQFSQGNSMGTPDPIRSEMLVRWRSAGLIPALILRAI